MRRRRKSAFGCCAECDYSAGIVPMGGGAAIFRNFKKARGRPALLTMLPTGLCAAIELGWVKLVGWVMSQGRRYGVVEADSFASPCG